jgi:hypothetical protein
LYIHDHNSLMGLVADLHILWHPDKTGTHFLSVSTFIDFEWNLPLYCVALPEKKYLKYLSCVSCLISDHMEGLCFNLHFIQVLHSTLVYISFVFPKGSSHLPVFSNFMMGYCDNNFVKHCLSDSFLNTPCWWHSCLTDHSGYCHLHPIGPIYNPDIFVNAFTSWGIGIIVGKFWHVFPLVPDWKIPSHDICWLEAVALELVVYFLH